MAQATLNPAINGLNTTSTLYDLYTRLCDGMTNANSVDVPDFVSEPIYKKNGDGSYVLDADGAKIVDTEAMSKQMSEYSAILIKNSAYMMANAIVSTISPNSGSGEGTAGSGFLSRSGDTMQGTFGALYGFEAGFNNKKIFETTINASDKKLVIITGNLQVSEDATVSGVLNLSNNGICFGGNQSIWYDQSKLCLTSQEIGLTGSVTVDGLLQIGDVVIDKTGVSYGKYSFYHSGNSNKPDVDWTMLSANVDKNLYVSGESNLTGSLTSSGGFIFSLDGYDLLYSKTKDDTLPYMILDSDLSIINNHGIKFNDNYIVWVRESDNIVSFSAPGAIMNLGDKGTGSDGNDLKTQHIALQSDIKNYNGAYVMISHDGSGNFPNGFSVGAANAIGATFQTYYNSSSDFGVITKDYLRFKNVSGPALSSDGTSLNVTVPFVYVANNLQHNSNVNLSIGVDSSSSLIYNPTNSQDVAAISFSTGAEHFTFCSPVEAIKFSVKSSKYKTRLDENVLFFSDGVFLEGMDSGMRLSGKSLFDSGLYSFNSKTSSISFSSGFAGSGWAIVEDSTVGGIHATFDSLTVRKKMRIYELELQKSTTTNGSLWVTDSCSGDEIKVLD